MAGTDSFRDKLFQSIGKKVAFHRSQSDPQLSQTELASRTGVSRAAVSALETGQQGVSVVTLCQLATALNIDPKELIPSREELSRFTEEPESMPAQQLVEEYLSRHG